MVPSVSRFRNTFHIGDPWCTGLVCFWSDGFSKFKVRFCLIIDRYTYKSFLIILTETIYNSKLIWHTKKTHRVHNFWMLITSYIYNDEVHLHVSTWNNWAIAKNIYFLLVLVWLILRSFLLHEWKCMHNISLSLSNLHVLIEVCTVCSTFPLDDKERNRHEKQHGYTGVIIRD